MNLFWKFGISALAIASISLVFFRQRHRFQTISPSTIKWIDVIIKHGGKTKAPLSINMKEGDKRTKREAEKLATRKY